VVLVVASWTWAALVLGAPYVVTHDTGESAALRGAALTYLVGRFVCHQRPDRSFHAWGAQLPVCSRCTGLYLAAPFGAMAALTPRLCRRIRHQRLRFVLLTAALPMGVAWALEAAGLIALTNAQRAASAVPVGFAVCWVATRALDEHREVN
jgi:uncharacterized membrane protein